MEVSRGVHLIEATRGSYAYLVLGDEPTLIDTGMPGRSREILAALARLGLQPKDLAHICLTHHDVDHAGNAQALARETGARVWASSADMPYITGEARPWGLRRAISALMPVEPVGACAPYALGERVGALEVIPTPGHTFGHVSLRLGDILFAGDLVTSRSGCLGPSPALLTADRALLRRSLREVSMLPFRLVCPAHGLPIERADLWEALLDPS